MKHTHSFFEEGGFGDTEVFFHVCARYRGELTVPDSNQAAARGQRRTGAAVLCGPVEWGRGVTVQGAAWHILQQLLLYRSPHRYKELQRGKTNY